MYERLPEYVKTHGRFCLWCYEQRNGKPTKVPYRTDGRRADSTKVSDFASFEDVLSVYSHGGYDGIGMMVFGDLSAIDIDHCVENGEHSPLAKEIADKLNSYTEYSPSSNSTSLAA